LRGDADSIIIGAGLAGLTCALELEKQGQSVIVLEASDNVGGRVRTDSFEGFLLDRGFQVLLTAYPECKRLLDYAALDLRPFYPGALVRVSGRFERVADPFRRPLDALSTLRSSIGTLRDKFRILGLRRRVQAGTLEDLFQRPATSTLEALRKAGFSAGMIDHFFRPFLGGIFFDLDLETTSRMFEFVFRMFSNGHTALPAKGMGEIPRQLASRLTADALRTGARVQTVGEGDVTLDNGERLAAKSIVVATEAPQAAQLLPDLAIPISRSTATVYFAAEKPPLGEPILVLDGEGRGPVTTLCVPSSVSKAYSPPGAYLISASIVGSPQMDDEQLVQAVRGQLKTWFGQEVESWRHLRTYCIRHALPAQLPSTAEDQSPQLHTGVLVCGDHRENASIQGAMLSGQRAANTVLAAAL
jgi:phytoene dehydrogenase-like protein